MCYPIPRDTGIEKEGYRVETGFLEDLELGGNFED